MPNPPEANQPASLGPRETQQRPGVVTTREARAADAGRLAEINVVTWRTAYDGIVPAAYLAGLDIAAVAKRWRARLAERSHERFYFVADVGDGVAAYAIGGPYRTQQDAADEDTAAWGDYALYTHPGLQGRGAGGAVLDAVLDTLAARGCRVAALWVLRDNLRAIRWYDARGWRADGATSRWDGAGEQLDEVRLTRPLRRA